MKNFKEKPVSQGSRARRKTVYGVGINDADYIIEYKENGVIHRCPFYVLWRGVLERCYTKRYQKKHPSYVGCTVCTEWLSFTNFRTWVESQNYLGKELDKDILIQGNKLYSPETCVFIDQALNKLLITRQAKRGEFALGVYFCNRANKFKAACCDGKKQVTIGYFPTEQEAHEAYCFFKAGIIINVANQQKDVRVKDALLLRSTTIHLQK